MQETLLSVKHLTTKFIIDKKPYAAVDKVSFEVYQGEILGVVGESGSGKSVTSLSILRLIGPPGFIASGEIIFRGTNLMLLSPEDMRKLRGSRISMIFQEPMTSLNPVFTVGDQIAEAIVLHQDLTRQEALAQAVEGLRMVEIANPEQRIKEYPHQMSGGMKQRAMIAMALACRPRLLIADEPTTALDVTIQAQVLDLMLRLRREMQMAILLITHDLGVMAEMADQVVVMYACKVVEIADAINLFERPAHPYTMQLLESVIRPDTPKGGLKTIPGQVPSLTSFAPGCRFEPRCALSHERCRQKEPPLETRAGSTMAACWREAI
jgi:oligopeptide/dipeptide ABC transporter ATP-binding protein